MITTQEETASRVLDAAKDLTATNLDLYSQADDKTIMDGAIKAFNAMTGEELAESDGWLLLGLVNLSFTMARPGGDFAYASRALSCLAIMSQSQACAK